MGLDVPDVLPTPAAFREGEAELEWIRHQLASALANMTDPCFGPNATEEGARPFFEAARHLGAIRDGAMRACKIELRSQERVDRSWASLWIAQGRAEAVYEENRTRASAALTRALEALRNMPAPSSVTGAQVQAFLWQIHETDWIILNQSAEGSYGRFREGGNPDSLVNAVLNAQLAAVESMVTTVLAQNVDWVGAEPGCVWRAPPLDSVWERVSAKRDRALELAWARWPADDANYISDHLGRLVQDWGPKADFYHNQSSVLGLLWVESLFDWSIAYDSLQPPYPTLDEATYLVAKYRNHTRTLFTEFYIVTYVDQFAASPPWDEDHPEGAMGAASMEALKWPFAGFECAADSA